MQKGKSIDLNDQKEVEKIVSQAINGKKGKKLPMKLLIGIVIYFVAMGLVANVYLLIQLIKSLI